MRHWEGLARYDEVLALANEHGGSVRRVSAPAAAPAPQPSPPASASVLGGRPFRKERRQNRQQERHSGGLVISRIGYDLVRASLRLVIALWPLWLFWFAWRGSNIAWREVLLTFHGAADPGYLLAYRAWPSVALAGPVALMIAALVAYRMQLAGRVMAYAGGVGVAIATGLTVWPEVERLAPYARQISLQTSRHGRHPVRGDQRHRSRRRRRLLLWRTRLGDRRGTLARRHAGQAGQGTDPRLLRQSRPCRLAVDEGSQKALSGTGPGVRRYRRRRSLPRRSGPRGVPPLRSVERAFLGTGRRRAAVDRSLPLGVDPCAGHRGFGRLQDDFGRRADDADLDRRRRRARSLARDWANGAQGARADGPPRRDARSQ